MRIHTCTCIIYHAYSYIRTSCRLFCCNCKLVSRAHICTFGGFGRWLLAHESFCKNGRTSGAEQLTKRLFSADKTSKLQQPLKPPKHKDTSVL